VIVIEEPLASWLMLLARICLAGVYLVSGVHKAFWYDKAVQEFRDARVPAIGFFLPSTIALHLLGGLALLNGLFVREAALALAAFTIVATLKVHCFWQMSGPERLARSRIAMAHLAIVGGLLLLAVAGPGRFVW
jgi:putative oxidoreductase